MQAGGPDGMTNLGLTDHNETVLMALRRVDF